MSATIDGRVGLELGHVAAEVPAETAGGRAAVSPLYRGMLEQTIPAGFVEAVWAMSLPFTGAAVWFEQGRCIATPLPIRARTEREAIAMRRRAEAAIGDEIAALAERWTDDLRPRAKALIRRIEAMELDRYAVIALPSMIDKLVDIAAELTAIRFRVAIPATTARVRLESFVAHFLKGFEDEIDTLLVGAPTDMDRAERGLCDLAGAARATSLHRLIAETPADAVIAALESAPLGTYYAAAIADYLRAYGFRHEGEDLIGPTWAERPEQAIARIQAMIVSGEDARDAYEARLTASVKAANAARSVLAEEPDAVRDQFEALLAGARATRTVQEDAALLLEQPMRAAIRGAFLELGARLTRLGTIARADDVFLLTLDEIKTAVSTVQPEAAIGMLWVRIFEREAELERPVSSAPARSATARPLGGSVDRAIGRLLPTAR